jgi:cytochrome P450
MTVAAAPVLEDLGSPAFLADPYPVYARLREAAPVCWHEPWQGWVVTRYADALAVLQDHQHFSNAGRQSRMLSRLPPEVRAALQPLEDHYTQGGLSNQDPPNHTRLRALISQAFTPRAVEALRAPIQAIIDDLLDAQTAPGFDLIRAFAYPLPALVIAQLMGLPPEDREQFKQWSDEVTAFLGQAHATPEGALGGQASMLQLRAYFAAQVEQRRREPGPDLISALLAAEDHGVALSERELLGTCVTLLLGGHETTTNLIGNGVLALLRHPAEWERLAVDPALIPSAVEELLRYDAPVQRAWRVVAHDVELGGQRLERGQLVFVLLGSANRDPRQFTEPDRLDVGRPPARSLSLGYGIHFCVGAVLGRLEAALALQALRQRWPALRLEPGVEPAWKANIAFRGLQALLVRFA